MRSLARAGARPPAVLLCVAVLVAAATQLAAASPPVRPSAATGWLVERVRFEPLDAPAVNVAGVGAFRGVVEVARAGGGVGVLNQVAVEDYVRGISEVPSSWPIEAQRAQAIAARTYALWERSRTVATAWRALGADICATQACQVYTGLTKERAGGSWAEAVASTAGQVLLAGGAPIKAMYSSSNGGYSVSGGAPYLPAQPDPDDAHSPLHRWRAIHPLASVQAAFGLPGGVVHVGRAGHLVGIHHDDGTGQVVEQRLPMEEFRAVLNERLAANPGHPLAIPSRRFDASVVGEDLVVDGVGFGHGIGMSQWGAFGKAHRGMAAGDILAAYYGGIRPTAVPPDQLPASLKVAVALERPSAVVAPAAGSFRVVDGSGNVLAVVAWGRWRVQPASGGVRVVPPPEQAAVPHVTAGLDPVQPRPGEPVTLDAVLSAPAWVRVRATAPGESEVIVTEGLRGSGDLVVALPPADTTGVYTVVVEADAGVGRRTEVPVQEEVVVPFEASPASAAAAVAAVGPDDAGAQGSPAVPVLVAAGLLLAAAAAGFGVHRRLGRR